MKTVPWNDVSFIEIESEIAIMEIYMAFRISNRNPAIPLYLKLADKLLDR